MKSKQEYNQYIDNTWKELKDFQRDTVTYVFNKFYKEKKDKFLVADEVGLGKTIVAKGLIAKAFESFRPSKSNPSFNVIYICSNQALAQENLKKLNFTRDGKVIDDPLNRLVYLALNRKKEQELLKFDSLTPSTSFTISNRSGTMKERAIIFTLLSHYAPFENRKNGLKWLLKGGARSTNWGIETRYYSSRKEFFRAETFKNFRRILFETKVTRQNMPRLFKYRNSDRIVSVWTALLDICSEISHTNFQKFNFKNEIIVCLRHLLTKVCLEYLSADLIILDEFQRYAEILETTEDTLNPAVELAQAVFELRGTKVLMLSATPFKPYTTIAEQDKQDGGEAHYKELKRVLEFLMKDKSVEFWNDFEESRRMFFSKISNPIETLNDLPQAKKIKTCLQNKYKEGIVRTERNKVSDDQNILVKSSMNNALDLKLSDIENYLAIDKVFQELKEKGKFKLPTPIDYSKSSPYPLSFSEGYQFRINLDELSEDSDLRKRLFKVKNAWINLNQISHYKPLGSSGSKSIVPNAKMQLLIDDLNESGAWKWLWVPPTITYYKPEHIFPEYSSFSKTLIFSSWKMVPRAISSIISYEAERLAMNRYFKENGEKQESYFSEREEGRKRKPTPLLTFKKKAGKDLSAAMSLFTLLYPSKYLIELYDPEWNIKEQQTEKEILKHLSTEIEKEFNRLGINKLTSSSGVSEKWYWAAPLLIDKYKYANNIDFDALIKDLTYNVNTISTRGYNRGEEVTGRNEKKHIEDLLSCFRNPDDINLGKVPTDLFDILALICLGSPSVCFSRSILKQFRKSENYEGIFNSAYSFAISKMHFFNKPENIAVVKSFYPSGSYWESVFRYCIEGNLQSSLDEFIHLLSDSGFKTYEIQEFYSDILSLRTSTNKVDDYNTFVGTKTRKLRTHYAIDFGTQDLQTDSGTGRIINVRQAFNSPYRPFILASTSIGQEGLDFHYYCGKVIHWNLPSNAIDIEQREGRINRYKGLIIRRITVCKYLSALNSSNSGLPIWEALFNEALKQEGKSRCKCELVPFWHVEPVNDLKIERIVPLYPFSKDIEKFRLLTETLTYYRLTFGQPRQEELVETLYEAGLTSEEIDKLRTHLLIDLSP